MNKKAFYRNNEDVETASYPSHLVRNSEKKSLYPMNRKLQRIDLNPSFFIKFVLILLCQRSNYIFNELHSSVLSDYSF